MPVTGVTMLANYPQESHCAKARLWRPPPRSPVRPSAVSSRRARAQRVHPWRLPWRSHAYRAALRVSPASKFSERYPSFPPNFTTFGHFLQPTTTWTVLTKPSSALLCKKILAPSKVGLNRKRSDFLDLPNGLFPSSFSDLPLLLSLFSWSISILFSLLRIHILSSSSSAFMLYSPTEQPISSSCTSCMALAHAIIELQYN